MCGRFTQYNSREEYLAFLGEEAERDIPYDPEPVGRYNVAPGTRVLLLSERSSQLHLDPVHWGYAPEWWNKPALINARSETAADSRMFRPLWEHGRAIVFADGWFEWKQQNSRFSFTVRTEIHSCSQPSENNHLKTAMTRKDCKRHIRTVFYFCPRFLPWTLSRTWTLPWTKKRLITEDPGSSLR